MLRKVFFYFILSVSFNSHASRSNYNDPYIQPIANEQLANEKIRSTLSKMKIGEILKLDESKGPISDETAPRRLTALYWVHTLNKTEDGVEVPKQAMLDNITTVIPQAFNNILKEVAKSGWNNAEQASQEEIEQWKKSNPSPLLKYVADTGYENKTLKSIDETTYYIAYKIYQKALEDRAKIQEHLRNSISSPNNNEEFQSENDKLAMALNDYVISQDKLRFEMGMQQFVQKQQNTEKAPTRRPASTGEHKNIEF